VGITAIEDENYVKIKKEYVRTFLIIFKGGSDSLVAKQLEAQRQGRVLWVN
jgi:hypothetical protein